MGDSSVFTRRLKDARTRKGLSQEQLGVLAGIDEFSASARMNQYERGKHVPDFSMVERVAKALDVPVEYMYAKSDEIADLLCVIHSLSDQSRQLVLSYAKTLLDPTVAASPKAKRK